MNEFPSEIIGAIHDYVATQKKWGGDDYWIAKDLVRNQHEYYGVEVGPVHGDPFATGERGSVTLVIDPNHMEGDRGALVAMNCRGYRRVSQLRDPAN